jgi:hypothetical protein
MVKCVIILVFKWHKRFSDGRGSLMDDKREERPSFKTSDVVKNEVPDVIDGDRRLTGFLGKLGPVHELYGQLS